MIFETISPEQAGLSSRHVSAFLRALEARGLAMHSVLLMKGDRILAECYWEPFDANTCHRMYSQTKSYTAMAIGLLASEGKLSLDDRIVDHFPEKLDAPPHPFLAKQTIRDMLTMRTACEAPFWFTAGDPDRTHLYLNRAKIVRPAGTLFAYDSAGSQVLASLVEKLSGKTLFAYLEEKVFRHLGTFRTATILQTPNGDSWGDSALVCTPRDMASFARLLMKGGAWNGRQLLDADFVRDATTRQTSSLHCAATHDRHGYGYQIWMHEKPGFAFYGMGCEYSVAMTDKDLLLVCTADNQYCPSARDVLFAALFDHIYEHEGDTPLPEDPEALADLRDLCATRALCTASGSPHEPLAEEINGRVYVCEPNPMGITRYSLHFLPDGTGEFRYTNAQGDKVLPFGLCRNVFTRFPQDGYSNERGGVRTTDGFRYRCASSAAWQTANKLALRVQIIDRYLGSLLAVFGFQGDDAMVYMEKAAEDFLDEYEGSLVSHAEETQEIPACIQNQFPVH